MCIRDRDGKDGKKWDIPTATVTISITDGHSYGEPVWAWSEDFTATATFTCGNDNTHVKTLDAAVTDEVTTPATCEKTGVRTYTCLLYTSRCV